MRGHFNRIAILCIVLWAPAILADEQQARPETWAKPATSEHLKNFYQLDDKVYRSAQPDKKGFQELERLGIRNVLSFRDHHSDDDARGTRLKLFRIKMEAGEIRDDQVIEALRIIRNAKGPVLIHCWHGSDRTGLVSAMYRIVFQDWSKDDAIDELTKGGYGYHSVYKNIPEYIKKADVEKMRLVVLADDDPRLVEVLKYREHVDRIERSAGKSSLQALIQEGTAIADRLRPVIEDLSETDYEVVVKNMKGFLVNREEVIVIEPDTVYFAALAKKHGIEIDSLYFQFLREVRPEGFWPVYLLPQTDFGGCIRYGEGHLANLYSKGKSLLPKMTGYYARETTKILRELSNKLTSGTCACGDRQSVIRELTLFLELNKGSEIAGKVKNRLEDIQKQGSSMRYHCVGGQ